MIAYLKLPYMTADQYLDWEDKQPSKHEYINGHIYAMVGGTLPHNDITLNLASAIKNALRETRCKVRMADAKVQISEKGPYFYPDIVVSCHETDRRAMNVIRFPSLIVEVLSPSTSGFDRGDKFKYYRQMPSLQEYVLIDAEKIGIDCYRKTSTGKWELTAYPEDDDLPNPVLELVSIGFSCPLFLIYEEVELSGAEPIQNVIPHSQGIGNDG